MNNPPPGSRAAEQLAWQHDHPLLVILFSTIITLVIITIVVLIRWLVSKSAWPYHPRGAMGFLGDEFVRWGAILVPYLALGITFKYYVYGLHPELNTPTTWGIFAVCAIAFRFLLRRLPFIKAMARHIDAAKAQARAARQGTSV